MRRFKAIALAAVILIIFSACNLAIGCELVEEYKTEYFVFTFFKGENGERLARVLGLTENGKEQEVLIVPETADGYPVVQVSYGLGLLRSEKLVRLFMPKTLTIPRALDHCFALKTVILLNDENSFCLSSFRLSPRKVGAYMPLAGYNELMSKETTHSEHNYTCLEPANISFMYNYNGSPNGGYYWIDNLDGESLLTVPENPARNGYIFVGWYKEPECINLWDFETDVSEKQEDGEGNSAFVETILYAKWLKLFGT